MKKTIAITLTGFLTAIFSFPLFSYELNGLFTTTIKADRNLAVIENGKEQLTNDLYISCKVPFNNNGTVYFVTEAFAENNLYLLHDKNSSPATFFDDLPTADLTLFKFVANIKPDADTTINLSAGRFPYSDLSRIIANQAIDGLYAEYSGHAFSASLLGGYTGLLNEYNNPMISTKEAAEIIKSKCYSFADPYLVGKALVSFPYLVGNHSLYIESLYSMGLPGPKTNLFGKDSGLYATIALQGQFVKNIYYTYTGTGLTKDFKSIAYLGKANITGYIPFKNMSIGANAIYTTGNYNFITAFVPLTKQEASLAPETEIYSQILKAGAGISLYPLDKLQLSLTADYILSTEKALPEYKAQQYLLTAKYQMFSDLAFMATADTYISKDPQNRKAELALKALISF